ncbi:MAG: sigma-70 family RNA polymerase sigma factor [Pedobacter sp.]|nr:MAG: sigma-70 family RNA polymerase sigma factor [Pedobacter sp.]
MFAFLIPFVKPNVQDLSFYKKNTFEESLITGLKKGEAGKIEELYRRYSPALYGIIKRVVKFDEIAEDVLQEAFVKIWKSINLYNPQKGTLFTWMANLAKNLAIDQVRSKSAMNSLKTDDILAISKEVIDHKSSSSLNTDIIGIKNLVYLLKSDQKSIVDLIYFQGYTHVQVAEKLCLPLGTVKTKLRLSILALRRQFKELKIPA